MGASSYSPSEEARVSWCGWWVRPPASGVPKSAIDSVYNQVSGGAARKDATIAKKLPPEQAKEILARVSQNFDRLQQQMADLPDTLLDLTHDRVDALGDDKKRKMVLDAFNEAGEFGAGVTEARRARRRA